MWSKLAVPTALGGQVIKAPNTNTVSNPAAQETVAAYEMEFATAGTYSAYYRVRGFSSSSDSIYAPDGFAVNPDNSITTNQDGTFFWKKDTRTFPIAAGNTGVPLEFRLGMREANAEIDAIVLNLSSTLSAAQLDQLFAVLPGDYNDDGTVDAADFTVWRETVGSQTNLAADGDRSGTVDSADFDVWKLHFGESLNAGAGGASVVPEPATVFLTAIAMASIALLRRRQLN
jgi:hypothetical protein